MEQRADEKTEKQVSADRKILAMGFPIIFTMVLQALYIVVDSAFVGNMAANGEQALNAITLAFPIQMVMVAVSIGTGVGVSGMLARFLGQGDSEKAGRVAGNAMFLGIVIYAVCLLFGLFGAGAYIATQTANPIVLEMGTNYLTICCTLAFGLVFFALFEKLLQATGRTTHAMIARLLGLVVNVVLDPILIYGLPGHSGLGVRGAAIVTVIGQIVSTAVALIFFLKLNTAIEKQASYMKPDAEVIRGIYAIGLPVLIAQTLIAVTGYAMNRILGRVDEAAIAAYGVYYRIQQVLIFAAFGMRDGIRPVLSYNLAKEDRSGMNDCISCGMRDMLLIMVIGMIAIEIFARPLASIFGLSGSTQELLVMAMRVIPLSLVFAGANIAYHGIFLALGAARQAFLLPVFRQVLFILPAAFGFSLIVGHDTSKLWIVWLAFLITELVTVLICVGFMKKIRWEKIDILDPAAKRREQELRKEQSLRDLDMPSNWF